MMNNLEKKTDENTAMIVGELERIMRRLRRCRISPVIAPTRVRPWSVLVEGVAIRVGVHDESTLPPMDPSGVELAFSKVIRF
jgi:hypothetical protein